MLANLLVGRSQMAGIVPPAEQSKSGKLSPLVLDNVYPAKGDDGAEIGGVFVGMHLILLDDGERTTLLGLYGVDFMPRDGRVEVQRAVAIHVAERHTVWLAVADERKHTRGGLFDDFDTFRLRQLLPSAAHRSEFHIIRQF